MTNALIITPATFKQQLIWRICSLLTAQKGNTFFLGDANITLFGGVHLTSITSIKGKKLHIEWTDELGATDTSDAKEFYIEDLWQIYVACEPIYQERMVDYATHEG